MKAGRIALLLAFALLLTACGAPEAEPSPTPGSSGGKVAVHWDALTPKPENVAKRWYEGYTDELIPSDDYGELVPYIGGEVSDEYWNQSWFFGLATREGVIVTDPVYAGVQPLVEMGASTIEEYYGDAMILRSAVPCDTPPEEDWMPQYENRYGLAAMDGSWYTGQIYTDCICSCGLGALFFDTAGDIVMISGSDGSELFHWDADSIPLEGISPGAYYWEGSDARDGYMQYINWGENGDADYTYVDLRTGGILSEQPEVFEWNPSSDERDPNEYRFENARLRIEDKNVSIEFDSGETHSFTLPEGCAALAYPNVNGERIIFGLDGGGSVLVDFDGKELLRTEGYLNWLYLRYGDAPSLCATEYLSNEDGTGVHSWHVYSRDGEAMFTADGNVIQWGDRLLVADETSYRLTDLEGSDLIRLSRFDQLDIPAEE